MKKILFLFILGLLFALPLHAQEQEQPKRLFNNFELMVAAKYGLMNVHNIHNALEGVSGEFDKSKSNSVIGINIGAESGGKHRFGVKGGFEYLFKNSLEYKTDNAKLEENAYMVPVTVYYKFAPKNTGFHFWIGAGAIVILADLKIDYSDSDSEKFYGNRVFFHTEGGIDYRFTRWFALGLDAGYNVGGKIKTFENKNDRQLISINGISYYQDYGGWKGSANIKFFF